MVPPRIYKFYGIYYIAYTGVSPTKTTWTVFRFGEPFKDNNRLKREIEKLTKQVENASSTSSSTSSSDATGRKRKATEPPEDFSQDKKVRNLQKQLLEAKKRVTKNKTLYENLKHTFGISPFTGKIQFSALIGC